MARRVDASYRFSIVGVGGVKRNWTIDLKRSPPFVGITPADDTAKVDAEFVLNDDDFIRLAAGKLKPDQVKQSILGVRHGLTRTILGVYAG